MEKNVTRFEVIEVTGQDVAIGFWYDDGTKEIIVVKRVAVEKLMKEIQQELDVNPER